MILGRIFANPIDDSGHDVPIGFCLKPRHAVFDAPSITLLLIHKERSQSSTFDIC